MPKKESAMSTPTSTNNGGLPMRDANNQVIKPPIDMINVDMSGNGEGSGSNAGSDIEGEVVKVKKEKPKPVPATPIEPLTRVIYPQVSVAVCGTPEQHGVNEETVNKIKEVFSSLGLDNLISYAPPLTAEDAIGLIGYEMEPKGVTFGDEWSTVDYYNKKVRLTKNIKNRPIYPANIESIVQNILTKRWELNGETIVVSDTGNVLDGQHTLVALCIAQQKLEAEEAPANDNHAAKEKRWAKNWPDGKVSIPKVIVYGIKGTDEVVNTMNTCRPRSFADVLYRSHFFSDLPAKAKNGVDRQTAAKATDGAVREVWQRTGLYLHGYGSIRTNSEGAAWLESHGGMDGKFLEYIRFILEKDVSGHISDHIPCGKAACLMWLMACGSSDQMKYYVLRNEDKVAEAYQSLKWSNEALAKSFWKEFGDREPDRIVNEGKENERTERGKARGPLAPLTNLLNVLDASDEPVVREKDFLIARAWNLWVKEQPITMSIKITDKDYGEADDAGVRFLKKERHLRFGNIDLGMDRIKPEPKAKKVTPDEQAKLDEEIEAVKRKTMEELASSEDKTITNSDATSTDLAGVKPQSQKDWEFVSNSHPEYNIVLVQTYSGKCEMWGNGLVDKVGNILDADIYTHPNDSKYLKLNTSDWDTISDRLVANGYSVGLFGKLDGGTWELLMGARAANQNPKKGKK